MVEGKILVCGYSYNFAYGAASLRCLSETAKSLGAVGFILAVENPSPWAKFDPAVVGIPGIVSVGIPRIVIIYNINIFGLGWTATWRRYFGVPSKY